jgi:hypothetical protein
VSLALILLFCGHTRILKDFDLEFDEPDSDDEVHAHVRKDSAPSTTALELIPSPVTYKSMF